MGNADDFLDPGESHPAVKLHEVGDSVLGIIVSIPDGPITRPSIDGDKEVQTLPITLEVNGELRTLWVQKYLMRKAIKEAREAAGNGDVVPLRVGGKLGVKVTGKEPVPGKPSPKTLYGAFYEPPADNGVSADDFNEESF